jgi:hypothetical protein
MGGVRAFLRGAPVGGTYLQLGGAGVPRTDNHPRNTSTAVDAQNRYCTFLRFFSRSILLRMGNFG